MTEEHAQAQPRQRLRYFVRRVSPRGWTRRRSYEVGVFVADGSQDPVSVTATATPTAALVDAGVHPTDAREYVENADRAWTGGVGPWRGNYPFETP